MKKVWYWNNVFYVLVQDKLSNDSVQNSIEVTCSNSYFFIERARCYYCVNNIHQSVRVKIITWETLSSEQWNIMKIIWNYPENLVILRGNYANFTNNFDKYKLCLICHWDKIDDILSLIKGLMIFIFNILRITLSKFNAYIKISPI